MLVPKGFSAKTDSLTFICTEELTGSGPVFRPRSRPAPEQAQNLLTDQYNSEMKIVVLAERRFDTSMHREGSGNMVCTTHH